MRYIRTLIVTVGTSQISKERKLFIRKTVRELLSFKFIPQGYFLKMKQISPIITKAIGGLLRTPHKGGSASWDTPASASPEASNLGQLSTLEVPSLTLGVFLEDNFLTDRSGGRFWGVSSAVHLLCTLFLFLFPDGSVGKESACNAGDPGSIPGLGRSGEGNDSPLQYSCLKNSMD